MMRLKGEDAFQQQCFWQLYITHRVVYDVTFAIPNGGFRKRTTAIKMKQTGAKAGVPDIFSAYVTDQYPGLFIELKVDRNKVSESQAQWIQKLKDQGYACTVVYDTCDNFMAAVNDYLTGNQLKTQYK